MNAGNDAFLGRLAVEKGLITEAQLADCVREHRSHGGGADRAVASGRTLGAVLVGRGLIKKKDLAGLLEEQDRRRKSQEALRETRRADFLFGQLLVKHDQATQNQINKCLEIQQQRVDSGELPIPRLGELLVEHGYVDMKTVTDILRLQNKDLLVCNGCGKQLNVIGTERDKTYRCKSCGGTMISRALLNSLRAEDTTFGFELPNEEK